MADAARPTRPAAPGPEPLKRRPQQAYGFSLPFTLAPASKPLGTLTSRTLYGLLYNGLWVYYYYIKYFGRNTY